jgi:hypothetical protein
MHHIQDLMQELFRKMPYEHMAGLHISGEELFAAVPNWVSLDHSQQDSSALSQAQH